MTGVQLIVFFRAVGGLRAVGLSIGLDMFTVGWRSVGGWLAAGSELYGKPG